MIVTVQQHILQQQKLHHPEASGEFSWLLSGVTLATKMIAAQVRRAGLLDVIGAAGEVNVQGEAQQKLDVYANQALLHCLGIRDSVAVLASEENDEPVALQRTAGSGKYIIVFDPLDGSSNIDVNVSVGTIFSILQRQEGNTSQNALGKSPRGTLFTARRRFSSTRPAPAFTALRSIPRSARTCSVTRTFGCRRTGRITALMKRTLTAFHRDTKSTSRTCAPADWDGDIRRATSARWWRTSTARC
jgi:hypothetical protein